MRTPLRCGMEYPRYSRRKRIDEPGSPVREGGVVHAYKPILPQGKGWMDGWPYLDLKVPLISQA